jgi:hypothetical protein
MANRHVIHRIEADRDYEIAQVGRTLEIRARETNAVLQVLEPPAEWGNDWLWSCCRFNGARCVDSGCVRFVRTAAGTAQRKPKAPPNGDSQPHQAPPETQSSGTSAQPAQDGSRLSRETVAALRDWQNGYRADGGPRQAGPHATSRFQSHRHAANMLAG